MSSETLLSHSELASGPPLINSKLGTYPPVPLPLLREGGIIVSEGASAPSGFPFTISYQKGVQEGETPLRHPRFLTGGRIATMLCHMICQ